MVTIEIDEDIFNYLKSLAEPFTDTPNTVLRRIIFPGAQAAQPVISTNYGTEKEYSKKTASSAHMFMAAFLQRRYGEKFRSRTPYRTMFESENYLVYFQNFNKAETVNLWYRLSEGSLDTLRKTAKSAMVCLTNPAANVVYEIPMRDIDIQVSKAKWEKVFLEVNIDPASSRWRELDWDIEKYLIKNNG
jgi:hypothetical protein